MQLSLQHQDLQRADLIVGNGAYEHYFLNRIYKTPVSVFPAIVIPFEKSKLIEEFYDEVFQGNLEVELHDADMNTWEVTFPYFLSEDIIDSIADYQEYGSIDEYDEYSPTDADEQALADWVRAEEFAARGMVDSDDLFGKAGISKSTAAIATAVLALGAAWWWSQRK